MGCRVFAKRAVENSSFCKNRAVIARMQQIGRGYLEVPKWPVMGTLAAPSRHQVPCCGFLCVFRQPQQRTNNRKQAHRHGARSSARHCRIQRSIPLALDLDQHWYAFASIHTNILKLRSLWLLRAMEHRERNVKSIIIQPAASESLFLFFLGKLSKQEWIGGFFPSFTSRSFSYVTNGSSHAFFAAFICLCTSFL